MTDGGEESVVGQLKGSNLTSKVVQYEQFLNDTLRGDLKYVKWSHKIIFLTRVLDLDK